MLNCSQCRHGAISQTSYETGARLEQAGVISGYDLTVEAAIAKLMFLFTHESSVDQIKRKMQVDQVGEMTLPT